MLNSPHPNPYSLRIRDVCVLMVAMVCSWLLQHIVCYVAYLLVNRNDSIRVFDGWADDAGVVNNHGDRRLTFSMNIGSNDMRAGPRELVGKMIF